MPLTVALHCSMVKKPQFVPPPPLPEYWAHHRVLSQGRAVAGVCVSSTVTSTSAAKTLVTERICKLPLVVFEITPCAIIYSSCALGRYPSPIFCATQQRKLRISIVVILAYNSVIRQSRREASSNKSLAETHKTDIHTSSKQSAKGDC